MKKVLIILSIACIFLWGCSQPNKRIAPSKENNIELTEGLNNVKNQRAEKKQDAEPQKSPAPKSSTTPAPEQKPQQQNEKSQIDKLPTPVRASRTPSKYVVKVNIPQQKVYVYKDNSLIKAMICSTGVKGKDTETPVGNFKINKYHGDFFYSAEFRQGAKYWVGFIGANFLFHSVPTDKQGKIIQDEVAKLGTPSSHGCVRLSMDDAYWFYQTVPEGADVIIQS